MSIFDKHPGDLIAGGSQRHHTLEIHALNPQTLSARRCPVESCGFLLLKVWSQPSSSGGTWKLDGNAESWVQLRAAESDALSKMLQLMNAHQSFSSPFWVH